MVAYHPRRYVSSWLIAKAMPPYETYAAPGGRRLTVWRAERRSSPAGSRLGRAPPQSTSSLVTMVGSSVHPGTQSPLAHGARGGDPVRVPRGLRRLFPEARRPCHPTQTLSPPRSCPATNKAWCAASRCARPRPRSPLVLGLLDLVAEDIAVGAHETKVRPQIHSTSFLCRSSTSAT